MMTRLAFTTGISSGRSLGRFVTLPLDYLLDWSGFRGSNRYQYDVQLKLSELLRLVKFEMMTMTPIFVNAIEERTNIALRHWVV